MQEIKSNIHQTLELYIPQCNEIFKVFDESGVVDSSEGVFMVSESFHPCCHGTVLIYGLSDFQCLKDVALMDPLSLTDTYGNEYYYKVTGMNVVDFEESGHVTIDDFSRELKLVTPWPLDGYMFDDPSHYILTAVQL